MATNIESITLRLARNGTRHLSLGQRLTRAWLVLEQWGERRRQRRALLALDDHMLRDIGISRADAVRVASKPFWAE